MLKNVVILHKGEADFSDYAVKADFQKPHNLVRVLCSLTALGSGAIGNLGNDIGYNGRKLNAPQAAMPIRPVKGLSRHKPR